MLQFGGLGAPSDGEFEPVDAVASGDSGNGCERAGTRARELESPTAGDDLFVRLASFMLNKLNLICRIYLRSSLFELCTPFVQIVDTVAMQHTTPWGNA